MKYTFTALALAAVAFGAESALIPSGISAGCTTFLEKLNSDSSLQTCVKPLIDASEAFSPTASSAASSSQIDGVLNKVCAAGTGCDDQTLRGWVSDFANACRTELSQGNKDIVNLYDVLYVTSPLKSAICSRDPQQKYCVRTIVASSKNKRDLAERAAADVQAQNFATIVAPNATTYQDTNLPFLFLQPSMPKDQLCTPCTRQIFVSYRKWDSSQPYFGGLNKSPILGGHNELYSAVNSTCGASFVSAIESEAGVGTTAQNSAARIIPGIATLAAGVIAVLMV